MDSYAQRLADVVEVPKLYTDIYQRISMRFNVSWFSKGAFKSILEDNNFIRTLNRTKGVVHLPNQHLGRYGNFLKIPYIITVHDLIRYFDLKGFTTYIHRPNFRDRLYLRLDYKGIRRAKRDPSL